MHFSSQRTLARRELDISGLGTGARSVLRFVDRQAPAPGHVCLGEPMLGRFQGANTP